MSFGVLSDRLSLAMRWSGLSGGDGTLDARREQASLNSC